MSTELLCFGFCRRSNVKVHDIMQLISLYHVLNVIKCETRFDNLLTKVERSRQFQSIWRNYCGMTVFAATAYNNTTMVARIRFNRCTLNHAAFGIINVAQTTVLKQDDNKSHSDFSSSGWTKDGFHVGQYSQSYGFCCNSLYENNIKIKQNYMNIKRYNELAFDERTQISILVDLFQNIISFEIEGINYGKAFDIEKNQKYRFVVSMK
eukprot:268435_1